MTIISIDLGLKRIGLALSVVEGIVTPLDAVMRKNRNQASDDVKAVLQEWSAEAVVIGIPLNGSSEDEMRRRITHFMRLVNFEGNVYLQDEAGTSIEAEGLMKGVVRNQRDGKSDSIAAQIILQRWFESSVKTTLTL